jgi:uncharacterized protein YaaN involved in tellurite resistance
MPLVVVNINSEIDPEIRAQLDRIEAALKTERREISEMTKVTDEAIGRLTEATQNLTNEVDSVLAFIDANVQAQRDLAAELEAEGADATKLLAFADATEANRQRLAAAILAKTPSDTGPIPPLVPSE